MSATIITTVTYPITDTASDQVNTAILKQELEDASLSQSVGNVTLAGSNVMIEMLGLIVTADVTAMDAVIAAHDGDEFIELPVTDAAFSLTSDDTGSFVEKCSIEAGPLQAGLYGVNWHCVHALTTTDVDSGSEVRITRQKNGGAVVEVSQDINRTGDFREVGAGAFLEVNDGDTYAFTLEYRRIGDAGNAAQIKSAWITMST